MQNKVATESDYWTCSGGIMPAQIHSIQRITGQKEVKKYLTASDTTTAPMNDFVCKHITLLSTLVTALVAVLIAAIGGSALGTVMAIAATGVTGRAMLAGKLGGLTCGHTAAVARTWLGETSHLQIDGEKALTTGSILQCNAFGSKIVYAPNVKTWWDALRIGMGNFGEITLLGTLGGSLTRSSDALLSGLLAQSLSTITRVNFNVFGSFVGWNVVARLSIFAGRACSDLVNSDIGVESSSPYGGVWARESFPAYGSITRVASGSPEPLDAMLLLCFFELRFSKSQ